MKVFVGADHNGFDYKAKLIDMMQRSGHEVIDVGDTSLNPEDDFPKFASAAVNELLDSKDPEARAVLVCGSGQGMAMAANRFKGIRASLCWNLEETRASRNDDDCNVLCLSARYVPLDEAISITNTFLSTPFAGAPRFVRRLQQLDQLG